MEYSLYSYVTTDNETALSIIRRMFLLPSTPSSSTPGCEKTDYIPLIYNLCSPLSFPYGPRMQVEQHTAARESEISAQWKESL